MSIGGLLGDFSRISYRILNPFVSVFNIKGRGAAKNPDSGSDVLFRMVSLRNPFSNLLKLNR